jgi:SAM-dependent methyltransferase
MSDQKRKDAVREQYAAIAKEEGSCCGPRSTCCSPDNAQLPVTFNDPYTDAEETIVSVADLGLGCGTPVKTARLGKGMTVVDLGSGAGIDIFLAARELGPEGKGIGIDMTDEMIARAELNRKKLQIQNVEFRKGEIENLPVESNSVDHVLSNCVINLVPDKRKAFAEIYRILKAGGGFTISDIVYTGTMPEEDRNNMSLYASCISGAEEKSDYLAIVREVGFRDVSVVVQKPYTIKENRPYNLQSITVSGVK